MSVTGDIIVDVTGVANTNPYDASGVTEYGDSLRVNNNKLRVWDEGGFYATAAASSDTVIAKATMTGTNGDYVGPALINGSLNGFYAACRYGSIYILSITAGVGSVATNQSLLTIPSAFSPGDDIEFEITNSTGAIAVRVNGSSAGTLTDATYSDLTAGYHFAATDYADTGASVWAASGYSASSPPTIRKSSTFDIETTLGTITTATLNSVNVFDHVTGQVGTTVSFEGAATDEITTSGEYSLVLGDGVGTETITVQVNVVGLPSNTAKKDGAILASLSDIELEAFDATGTHIEQLTGLASNASAVMSPVDFSSTTGDVGDNIKVSLYSPSTQVGITFTQALELI